jgi:hypothetical protein
VPGVGVVELHVLLHQHLLKTLAAVLELVELSRALVGL